MKQMEGRKDEIREDHYYVLVTILVAIPFIIPLKALKKKKPWRMNLFAQGRSDLGTWIKLYKDHGTSKLKNSRRCY